MTYFIGYDGVPLRLGARAAPVEIRLPNRGPEASGPVQQRIGIGTTVTRGPVAYNIVEQIPV